MAKICFRAHNGKVAIWVKPPSGDPMAPFTDPLNNLQYVRFHSDFQYLSDAIIGPGRTVNHTSVAGVTGTGFTVSAGGSSSGATQAANGQVVTATYDLYTHNLGYVPLFFVVYNGEIISGCNVVQEDTEYRSRTVSVFATTTKIRLKDVGYSSANSLGAVSRSYDVYIFKNTAPDMSKPLFRAKPGLSSEAVVMGHGKITSDQRVIRRAASGEALLYFPLDRVADIGNGAIRTISPISGVHNVGKYLGHFFTTKVIPVTL